MASFVSVEIHASPWHAHIACGLLMSEGVDAVAANEHHVWVNWPWSQALGGVHVLVPAGQLAHAGDVLQARDRGEYGTALCDAFGEPAPVCPSCGGHALMYARSPVARAVLFLITLAFGVSFPPAIAGTRCRTCGDRHVAVR
jgi:hypothetical protein